MKEQDIRSASAHSRYLELVREDISRYFVDPDVFDTVACPACDDRNHAPEFAKAGFQYVTCLRCGTLYVTPRPPAKALEEFYVSSPSSRYWIESFFRPVAEARREKIFRPRADYVARQLSRCKSATVGDVGAGFGLFLEELRTLWPESRLIAIEPSIEMAQICRSKGLKVFEATLEGLTGYDGQFGLLTAFELLEHLYEPRTFLERAFRLLAPNGALLITTLNGHGFDVQVLWERSKTVFPPHHLNFFNPPALRRLCENVGFLVEEVSTPGELDWDIVERRILDDGVDPGRFWVWLARNGSSASKRDFQSWLSQNGLSSHMRMLARKP